jgi:hypothetical protein
MLWQGGAQAGVLQWQLAGGLVCWGAGSQLVAEVWLGHASLLLLAMCLANPLQKMRPADACTLSGGIHCYCVLGSGLDLLCALALAEAQPAHANAANVNASAALAEAPDVCCCCCYALPSGRKLMLMFGSRHVHRVASGIQKSMVVRMLKAVGVLCAWV